MKSVGCCGGEPLSQACGLPAQHKARPSGALKGSLFTSLQTPYQIKLTACTRKHLNINITNTGKGNNRRWQAPGGQRGQRAIPPDGFDMAALEITLDVKIPPALCATSLFKGGFFTQAFSHSFQGRLIAVDLQTPYFIKSPACTRKHLNINITDTGKGNNRRWQAPGGQRGQRANSAGRFRHGCTRKLLPSGKPAGRCGHHLNAVSHPSGCFLILSLRRGYFCGVGTVFRIRISFRSPAVGRV